MTLTFFVIMVSNHIQMKTGCPNSNAPMSEAALMEIFKFIKLRKNTSSLPDFRVRWATANKLY